jgi:arylsulfatase A-like enzyme
LPGDGRDLYKQAIDRDAVVSEFHEANWVDPVVHQRVAMLRDRDWKYVITEGDTHELYDMRPRPVERDNLIDHPTQRDRVARMHRRLTRDVPWVASVPIPLPRD